MYQTDWYWTYESWYEYAKLHYLAPVSDQPPEWVTLYYDPQTPAHVKTPAALAWHKLCWYLAPQDPEMARLIYAGSTRRFAVREPDGATHFAALEGLGPDDRYATALGLSLAKEFGVRTLSAQLRKWAEARYQPTFDPTQGEFYYRFGRDEPYPRGQYNGAIMPAFVGDAGLVASLQPTEPAQI